MEPRTDPTAAQDAAPVDTAPDEAQPEREIDYWGQGEALFRRCIQDAGSNSARLLRDRADILNLKFERGGKANQWTVWDNGTQRYVERGENPDDGGLPAYIPRPVTNVLGATIRGVVSILDQSEPAQVFAPKEDADEDQATAEVCADAVPVLRAECGYDSQAHRHTLNSLATLTNGSAYIIYYDADAKYGMAPIDMMQCSMCGEIHSPVDIEDAGGCPTEGCEGDYESFETATYPEMTDLGAAHPMAGRPLQQDEPIGRICAEVIPSFEYSLPSSARRANPKACPWVLTHSRMAPHDIARMWPKAKDTAKDRSKWAGGSLTRAYADQMRALASPATGESSSRAGSEEFQGPVVYRLQHDPIDDGEFYFPDGFYGVMIADQLIAAEKLPFADSDGQSFKNVLIRTYTEGNGTPFGHPPADDLVPIQQARNIVEAMIQLIIMHDAAPTRYLPESVTLIDEPTGVPGEIVRYRSMDGQKPTTERGQNPPEALFNYLDRLDAKFQELSGLNAVLAGQRPEGDPTLGEVQILEERGMATFRAPLDSLIEFEKDLSFMLLNIGRQTLWSPRFRRIRGENRQWELKQFAAADLNGEVDIQVERASAWPKSPLMQQLRINEALQKGILPPPAQDPELQGKLLVDMNLAHLKPSYDDDRRQVARLLDKWKAARTPQEILDAAPDTSIIELSIHVYLIRQFLKSEEVEDLRVQSPALYQAMVQQYQQLKAAQQQEQMQAAAMQNGPPPAQPGAQGTLDAAMQAGVLQPQGGPGAGGTLDEATASGALVPAEAAQAQAAGAEAQAAAAAQGPSIDDLLEAKLLMPVMPEAEDASGGMPTGMPPM